MDARRSRAWSADMNRGSTAELDTQLEAARRLLI
jgi:hypothetical protein